VTKRLHGQTLLQSRGTQTCCTFSRAATDWRRSPERDGWVSALVENVVGTDDRCCLTLSLIADSGIQTLLLPEPSPSSSWDRVETETTTATSSSCKMGISRMASSSFWRCCSRMHSSPVSCLASGVFGAADDFAEDPSSFKVRGLAVPLLSVERFPLLDP